MCDPDFGDPFVCSSNNDCAGLCTNNVCTTGPRIGSDCNNQADCFTNCVCTGPTTTISTTTSTTTTSSDVNLIKINILMLFFIIFFKNKNQIKCKNYFFFKFYY